MKIINKRIPRDLKSNLLRYLALFLLIICSTYFVVSMVSASATIEDRIDERYTTNKTEDGEFVLFTPLKSSDENKITSKGVQVEQAYYLDYKLEDGSKLRAFKNRVNINLLDIDDGELASKDNEVCIEKQYATEHNLNIDDYITIADKKLKIVGIVSAPDYESVLENITDTTTDHSKFGLVFMNDSTYEELKETGSALTSESLQYFYRMDSNADLKDSDLKNILKETKVDSSYNVNSIGNAENLISFTTAENNSRTGEVLSDISIVKEVGMLGGLIVFILIVYIVSIFSIHQIDLESSIIGTVYSMGMKKSTLMKHYIALPVAVTFLGGVIGTIIGFTPAGISLMINSLVSTYSLPEFNTVYPIYLIFYGIIVPPLTAILVNVLVLNRKLSKKPLELLRNQQKQSKVSKIKLKNWKFINAFRFRQFLREGRCAIAIFVGVFLSTVMLMMSQFISVGLGNMGKNIEDDIKFNYMYMLKSPNKDYEEGEQSYIKNFSITSVVDGETTFQTSIMGVPENSKYFDFDVTNKSDELTISSSVALKFNLKEGDTIKLYDETEEKDYSFKVANIAQFSAGLYNFMNIDTMRALFDTDPSYYNAICSDSAIDIDSADLYSTIRKSDFTNFVDVFVDNMSPMIYMMFILSIVIFFAVLYLMLKVIIDHSAFSISMMRVFGYRNGEIRKLYLDGNFIIFIVSAILSVPMSKKVMEKKWPQMTDHVSMGIDVSFSWMNYLIIFGTMLAAYFIIAALLNHKLKKQLENDNGEILKNRE